MIKASQSSTLSVVDRVGATVSFACAVHCVAMPFLLSVLPLLGLSVIAHETFERCMLVVALVFAVTSSCWGLRIHRSGKIAALFFIAIALLGFSRVCAGITHGLVLGLGGLTLSAGHFLNHHLCRSCSSCDHHGHDGGPGP